MLDKPRITRLIDKMINKGYSLSFAESMSAGKMASAYSSVPGSGEIIRGGIVAYHEDIKHRILGVSNETLRNCTAESKECTREMLDGLKKLFRTDVGIAITGLASPGGSETAEKPVGTVFLSIYIKGSKYHYRKLFRGSAVEIINKSINFSAAEILKKLK